VSNINWGKFGATIGGYVLGALVGALIPGIGIGLGAMLGGVIGGVVGSLVSPDPTQKVRTQGPRLQGLQVQNSAFGIPIEILYGHMRKGGNVIWTGERQEHRRTTTAESGGSTRNFITRNLSLCRFAGGR
jgi:gas vesicle protein